VDLSLADSSPADISLADLSLAASPADLSLADLNPADLSLVDLSLAGLSLADLSRVDLSRVGLSRVGLSPVDISLAGRSPVDPSSVGLSLAGLKPAGQGRMGVVSIDPTLRIVHVTPPLPANARSIASSNLGRERNGGTVATSSVRPPIRNERDSIGDLGFPGVGAGNEPKNHSVICLERTTCGIPNRSAIPSQWGRSRSTIWISEGRTVPKVLKPVGFGDFAPVH
jgi:hypothetical protein